MDIEDTLLSEGCQCQEGTVTWFLLPQTPGGAKLMGQEVEREVGWGPGCWELGPADWVGAGRAMIYPQPWTGP